MNISDLITSEDREIVGRVTALLQGTDRLQEDPDRQIGDIAMCVHSDFISRLICTYVYARYGNAGEILELCFGIDDAKAIHGLEVDEIPALCERLHISFLNSKFSIPRKGGKVRMKSKERLVGLGAVYTRSDMAGFIVESAVRAAKPVNLQDCRLLDFACGTGRFYENIVALFDDRPRAILNNIYAMDIDPIALLITRLKALSFFSEISEQECIILCNHISLKDGLVKSNDLDGLAEGGFDIIVSNPPYRVLKPDRSKAGTGEPDGIQAQVAHFRNCGVYTYAIEGMLNLYQLSIERMLQMLKKGGILGVICPSTLFGDVSASKLRKHLLLDNRVINIRFFAEKAPLFENVSQATNIFILEKGGVTDNISISAGGETFAVDLDFVKEMFPVNLEIPVMQSSGWAILRKLAAVPKLKECKSVRNRRGELDLSIYKRFITSNPTPYRLVRGNMIGANGIRNINGEFVAEGFLATRSNDYRMLDFNRQRLVCQQVSNAGLSRRLRFVFCERTDILGNSCNYLSADLDTLHKLYLILNSSILNWRFKLTSSNNHINNYELAELPIIDFDRVDGSLQFSSQEELDEYVGGLYGLNHDEIRLIAR